MRGNGGFASVKHRFDSAAAGRWERPRGDRIGRSDRMASPDVTAVLGAGGTMGFAIARNLARAGIPVRAWNRTLEKARPLEADGATIAPTPAAAAVGAGVVLTMLSDADAVLAAMAGEDGALSSMDASSVWLQMSTIGEAAPEE